MSTDLDELGATGRPHREGGRAAARARARVGVVRHARPRRFSVLATIAKIAVSVIVVALISSVSVTAIATWQVASTIKPGIKLAHLPGVKAAPAGEIPQIGAIKGGVNLLLVGTDTRTGQGGVFSSADQLEGSSGAGNNDVTILMHIAQDHRSATVVSFPRDLMLPIPSCPDPTGGSFSSMSSQMLNSSLTYGGLPCPVLTIEKLTGLTIPFAAEITFDGVTAMSNAVGGVSVCLATPVKDAYTDPQLNLPAGEQTLVGPVALSFLRSRHGIGDGSDLGRISNQQVFLSALVRKIKDGGVLSNPLQLYPLAKAAVSNMRLSDTLENPSTMVQIALALKNIPLSNVVFLQYPVFTDPDNVNRVVPDTASARVLMDALVADQPVQLTGTTGRAAEVNTSAPVAPDATAQPDATSTPADAGTATAPAAPGTTAVALPSNIVGQTAAQQTCTKGNN
ncbi:MAG: LytR family transcriptional regulator [Microbacteriaceae bacterium]|nr:MAG: LytR family transcriptional regulator [Microbacteriaceae bacterium]